MTRKPINAARPIKRAKATKAQMAERREGLEAIISGMHPMTVRQVFYQATVQGLIEKTEAGYDRVQTLLADMRRDGDLPYHWIVDLTRRRQAKQTYSSDYCDCQRQQTQAQLKGTNCVRNNPRPVL